MGYHAFAEFYDELTLNIDYGKRANYFSQVFERFALEPKVVLDLACGTGSLTFKLAELGYDMIGTDASLDMLEIANFKKTESTQDILFVHQPMQSLELHGKVDAIICALDSINHLEDEEALEETIERVSMFTREDGLFIFDVNTEYKHKEILADNCYIYELDDLFCAWQNTYHNNHDHAVEILLDFFVLTDDGLYEREEESFFEKIYSHEVLEKYLTQNGFKIEGVFAEDSFDEPSAKEQRLIYVARKNTNT